MNRKLTYIRQVFIIFILLEIFNFDLFAQNPSLDLVPERLFIDRYEDHNTHISDFTNKNYSRGNIKKAFRIVDCLGKKDTIELLNFGKDGWRVTSKTEISCQERKKEFGEILEVKLINDCFTVREKTAFSDSSNKRYSGGFIYQFNKLGYVIRILVFDSASLDTDETKYGYDKYNRVRYSIETNPYKKERIEDHFGNFLGYKRIDGDTFFYESYYYKVKDDTLIVDYGYYRGFRKVYYYNPQGKFVRMEFDYPGYVYITTKTKRTLRHLRRKKIKTTKYTGKTATEIITETIDPGIKFIYY
jgi:hypothetical protein